MKLKLPDGVYAPDQLLMAAEELREYAVTLAQRRRAGADAAPEAAKPAHLRGKLSSAVERVSEGVSGDLLNASARLSPEAAALLELLPAPQRNDDHSIEELRAQLEQLAETSPAVTIVLAAPATRKLKAELAGWLRAQVRPDVLVSFHVNPDIAGGMVIRTPSRVHDSSFRTLLLQDPQRLTGILDHV